MEAFAMCSESDGQAPRAGLWSATGGRDQRVFLGGRMKILIVDDDDDLVAFLAKELEARGCKILQTHSGVGG